jgi:plastocyanin
MKLTRPILVLGGALALAGLAYATDQIRKHVVDQKDRAFSTKEISVKVGEAIVFQNSDEVTHNVFSNSKANAFVIKTQKPGESSAVEFKEPGTTEVRCAIHPGMKLVVNVTE